MRSRRLPSVVLRREANMDKTTPTDVGGMSHSDSKCIPSPQAGYVMCMSGRARDRVQALLGRDRTPCFLDVEYMPRYEGCIFPVSAEELTECLAISSVKPLARRNWAYVREWPPG